MSHIFLTVAIPFPTDRVPAVEQALDRMGNPAQRDVRDRLRDKGIHFMAMTIVPADTSHGPFLILEASADPDATYKDDLTPRLARDLDVPLNDVLVASGKLPPHGGDIAALLRRHQHTVGQSLFSTPGLCFTGTPATTVRRIRDEYELSRAVRGLLESGDLQGTPLQILNQVRQRLQNTAHQTLLVHHDSPLLEPAPAPAISWGTIVQGVLRFTWPYWFLALVVMLIVGWVAFQQVGVFWGLVAVGFVVLVSVLGFVALAGWIYSWVRSLEASDVPDDSAPEPVRLAAAVGRENRTEQNHLFCMSVMKPGWIRNLVLRVVYWVILQGATTTSKPGFLGEIGTIHFARWILLPGTNKLLFFSNYGGSWESYLEDFITNAHQGLTGVWSNTIGFPRASNVINDGATDGDRFKRWARRQQYPTRFWYSAYPHLTTARIRLHSAIRQGLVSAATEDEASQWLSCLGSRPRVGASLETIDIPAIVYGGFSYLHHSACLVLRLPQVEEAARNWLKVVEPGMSFGDTPPMPVARLIGFTHTGLTRLGLPPRLRAEFPVAFQEGMDAPSRAAFLRDTGEDQPRHWWWGHGERAADAVVLLYAADGSRLEEEVTKLARGLEQEGGAILQRVSLAPLVPGERPREPFGFVDGVSQPIVRGTRRWIADSDANHVVEPGEFILGYPDNRGFLPLSPTVPATFDPFNVLPAARELRSGELPNFSRLAANGPRDLGRNGTYLVVRQLEQDVGLFDAVLTELASRLQRTKLPIPEGLSLEELKHWLAAKMIGRWKDGTSMVRYPRRPGTGWNGEHKDVKPDNAFLLGAEDPLGERCPFGSHIRRTNPRDSLVPGSKRQLEITNRHRILRVGRTYEAPPEGKPGLLFMCLNADIERQFEFIQQTWASARLFHGLDGEVDPILGRGGLGGRLTIPTERGPVLVTGFKDFVTTRGGAYFFLPGRRALWFLAGKSTALRRERWFESTLPADEAVEPTLRYGRIGLDVEPNNTPSNPSHGPENLPAWDEIH